MPPLNDRTGEVNVNIDGSIMEIVEYINNKDVLIRFLDSGNLVRTSYATFKNGKFKNPYIISVYGIGYFGEGIHKSSENNKMSHKYKTWHGMMRRCYDEEFRKRSKAYSEVTVCTEWHNYQNFGNWYEKNYYTIDGEQMQLDKDILIKGNRVYSPETCIFVPSRINGIFTKDSQTSSKGLPPLTFYEPERTKKYVVRSHDEYIGSFKTIEEAVKASNRYKEIMYKSAAYEYKGKIPEKLYKAMLDYAMDVTN